MLTKAQITAIVARNFADRAVKPVTIEIAQRHVSTLIQTYQDQLFSAEYETSLQDLLDSDLKTETKKARIVNWTRFVRTMTTAEFKKAFAATALDQAQVLARLDSFIAGVNGGMADAALKDAKDGVIDEAYIPYSHIYDRAEQFVKNPSVKGDQSFVLRCKILVHLMILDHPPRRNELLELHFPPAPVGVAGTNVWDGGGKIYINKYKTYKVHKEYIMTVSEGAQALLKKLRRLHPSASQTRVFPTGTVTDYLSAAVGFKLTCNQIRHAFITYVYGGTHNVPIYPHEKEDLAKSMGHSVASIDGYIVRLKPYIQDKEDFFRSLVAQRHKRTNAEDKARIAELSAGAQKVSEVGPKLLKRTQTPEVTSVLRKYSNLFLGKTADEKRRDKPYLYLSQCTDIVKGTGKTVSEVLGDDSELIKKWCSVLIREDAKQTRH